MEKIEKGSIIEIKVPNVEEPIKAVVLDIIRYAVMEPLRLMSLLCYAQKRLFKVSYEYTYKIKFNENGFPYEEYKYINYKYDGIIIDYCEIPSIPDNL